MENTSEKNRPFLELKHLTKKYGLVKAVDDVSFEVYPHRIKGLIGENGSGKSTVSSMVAGFNPVTSGEMFINGQPYSPKSALDGVKAGIAMVVQESGTIPGITVAQNIFIGQEKRFCKFGIASIAEMTKAAKAALEKIGVNDIDPSWSIDRLTFEQKKLVEIAKALKDDVSLFIVDETTTALSENGRQLIHRLMKNLRDQGKCVMFISHDLEELIETCDELTVMRDGKLISNLDKSEFDEELIKKTMVGRKIEGNYYRADYEPYKSGDVWLRCEHINSDILKDVSLELHAGEILGIGGLSGSGMHEIGRCLFGLSKYKSGKVEVRDYPKLTLKQKLDHEKNKLLKKEWKREGELSFYPVKNNIEAIRHGIGYVSKDRDTEALISQESIKDNLVISNLDDLATFEIVSPFKARKFAQKEIDEFRIKCSSGRQTIKELSGGNKQKVSFAKWIGNGSRVLIFDSPTRGVDVGVKTTMYQLLYELKKKNYPIIIISEEMSELIGMSDRILVFKDGAISHEFFRSPELDGEQIIRYMI